VCACACVRVCVCVDCVQMIKLRLLKGKHLDWHILRAHEIFNTVNQFIGIVVPYIPDVGTMWQEHNINVYSMH
jgi:hypothetical protein